MKKIITLFILFLIILFPFTLKAKEGISNYYIDATVLDNGDMRIKELFILNGKFNGFERIIAYRGTTSKIFDGSLESFNGSTIYNGDSIIINQVKGIDVDSKVAFDYINKSGDIFDKVNYATKGDYGKYIQNASYTGTTLTIYNPNPKKGFYVDYTITNLGIVHQDIAEIGFNIFTELTEYVDSLEMYIHIPNNKGLLRAWGHGPLTGNVEILSKETIKLTIQELGSNTPIDVRFAFDKNVINKSIKTTDINALEKIIEVETIKADEANQIREEARARQKNIERMAMATDIIKLIWLITLIVIIVHTYKKYDKEYKGDFTGKYYRDFPNDYSPATVGYLLHKNVGNNDLSASILNLIYKKIITFEPIPNKKNDYTLKYEYNDSVVTKAEDKLINFLFEKQTTITLSTLKKRASRNYERVIKNYTSWKREALNEAESYDFYETHTGIKTMGVIWNIAGIIIAIYTIALNTTTSFITFALAIGAIIYFLSFNRRTPNGSNDYVRWIGLKNFMEDFGRMDKKDLPEIVLWEKYLVYAVTLGCANKLAKTMAIKVKEFSEYNDNLIFDYYRFNTIMSLNNVINSAVSTSMASAYNARNIANSNNSSGSGFGGGFSGGGGSFGGGGGGGRF